MKHVCFRSISLLLLMVIVLSLSPAAVIANPPAASLADFELLGLVEFETGSSFDNTEVGGLSGITYDAQRDVYYALSDDRSQTDPARYYTVDIDLSDAVLDDGDVTFEDVTFLVDDKGIPFPPRGIDPEGIALARPGFLYISSEGSTSAEPPLDPFVNRYNLNGRQTKALAIPQKFLPNADRTSGVRNNLAFESLTATPDSQVLYTATENALLQDGPRAAVGQETYSRILRLGISPAVALEEYVYVTGAVPIPPDPPDAFADNGLVELIALDDHGTLLALERSFAVGVGNTIRLYKVSTTDATDVSGLDDLYDENTGTPADFVPVAKQLVLDLADVGVDPDNVEGMTLGPILPDGRQTLILVSDNNFNPAQVTQFIALAVK